MSFKAHWNYLKYVLEHKYWVYVEGRKLGVGRWQLLCHDLSKFSRAEWSPYVRKFYGKLLSPKDKKKHTNQQVTYDFKRAWLHHQNVNPHHWQYWFLLNEFGCPEKALEMPREYMLEMVADWRGVSRVKHKNHTDEEITQEVRDFYINTLKYRKLHENTQKEVERMLGVRTPSLEVVGG